MFSRSRIGHLDQVLSGYIERREIPGIVALVARGDVVHVTTAGSLALDGKLPMRRDTIFRIASMTKPVTAVAAMILVEECKLRLDEPVDDLLPELANRRVLKRVDGPLDDTEPARRPISLRDLLTSRPGFGHIMVPCDDFPIRQALNEQKLLLGPPNPQSLPGPDEWMRRVGEVPLVYHPGEQWMYDLPLDVLGVLVARAAEQPLDVFMHERIFAPLGMPDTGFHVPADKLDRLPVSYCSGPGGGLDVYDAVDGQWARPPVFASGGGGLVSTVDDYLAFCRMLLNKGSLGTARILSRASVELMTANHLSAANKTGVGNFLGDGAGWGFGMGVDIRRDDLHTVPGRFGWDGGLGTSGYTDPEHGLIGILLTQRMMDSPAPPRVFSDFWTGAYAAMI